MLSKSEFERNEDTEGDQIYEGQCLNSNSIDRPNFWGLTGLKSLYFTFL